MQTPSKAHLWTRCALSGSLVAGRADGYVSPHVNDPEESDSRREGTAAHWLAGEWFAGRLEGSPVGLVAPNGWVIDAEMEQHVRAYCDYVATFGSYGPSVEAPVQISDQVRGRVDSAQVRFGERVIRVFDLKYGWRLVEAEYNPELLCHGVGLNDAVGGGFSLELHIYQPRPFHPEGIARSWVVDADDVIKWRDWLIVKAQAANHVFGQPFGTPGDHCRDCPGKASCQALAANVYAQYDVIRDSRLGKMDTKQLAAELDFLEQAEACLKQRKAGVEAEAEGRIAGGEFIAGWELADRKGHRKFSVPMAQVQMMTGIMPFKQTEMTPAELERAGAKKDIVKGITYTPSIGRKLARASTKAFEKMFKGKGT
jgi:hypothetical protein